MSDKGAPHPKALVRHAGFEGGIEDLSAIADEVLAALGVGDAEEAGSINPRLIRDYAARGILSRPERVGKEALYRYQHLAELVAARVLLNDGWPLAKVADYVASARLDDLAAWAAPQSPAKSALRAIKDIRDRSRAPSSTKRAAPPRAEHITSRQVRLAELRSHLPHQLGEIDQAYLDPVQTDYASVSFAEDLHLFIGTARLRSLTLDQAEAIGRAITASLIQLRPKGGKP